MHNLLSLDGGGTKGMFSIQILARMEKLLRQKYDRPDLVLADHFDFIGGTSTGAIIAALLSWGASVETVENFYLTQSHKIFGKKTWLKRFRYKFHERELIELLRENFSEDGRPALLGTKKLKTLYLCVMRNATTGAPWIITNSPHAKYNQAELENNNLKIPLYQLIRASTAAPVFFRPEEIEAGGENWLFLDGAVTPYNNPAFIMYLTATLPAFGNNWKSGIDNMRLISIGTGRRRVRFSKTHVADINVADQLSHSLLALIDSNGQQQDLLCRSFGRCQWGEPIDTEVGDMIVEELAEADHRHFLYSRYNHNITPDEIKQAAHIPDFFEVDSLNAIPFWQKLGREFAEKSVRIEHLA
jgi:uncharacterized protein